MSGYKSRRLISLLLVVASILTVLWPSATTAAPTAVTCLRVASTSYQQAIAQARAIIQKLQSDYKVPGLTVAVAADGKLLWSEGFGYADVAAQTKACPSTRFRIASITKTLTSAAMARLYQQGDYDFDAPIQQYVPSYPAKAYAVTPRLVASHQGGISARMWSRTEQYNSVLDSLRYFKNDPLIFKPGTAYAYSNLGYELLAASLEGASGKDYATTLRQEVLDPLGMTNTVPDSKGLSNVSKFYSFRTGTAQPAREQNLQAILGAGGYLSTSEDLVKFGAAMLGDDFLSPSTTNMLWTEQVTTRGLRTQYGLGWLVRADRPDVIGHTGALGGTRSYLIMFPDSGVVIAMLANRSWSQAWPPAEAVQIAGLFGG